MRSNILYARKSTESDDRQILSIDSQIHELRLVAMRQGLGDPEILRESQSAKAPGRPVFNELMRRVERGQVKSILCWKLDRLARNHLDHGRVLQALADYKLESVITSDRTYTPEGNDRFIGTFELGMATKFIDDLRANVKRGLRARLEQGWPTHNPPPGYRNDPETKHVVKDPERFDLIRRMWELLLRGSMTPPQILRIANEEWGFRTLARKRLGGKPLARSKLYAIFENPYYMGIIRLRSGQTYIGAHQPMVSKEEFERAQELIGRPGNKRPRCREFAFTGLITCGTCGGMITAEEHTKPSGRRYIYYHCSRKRGRDSCAEPSVSDTALGSQVETFLRGLTLPPRALKWLNSQARSDILREATRRTAVRQTLEKTIAGVRRSEEALLDLRLREMVDDALFTEKRQALAQQRQALELKLSQSQESGEEIEKLVQRTFVFSAKAAEVFRSSTPVQKRVILATVGSNPTLTGRKLRIEYRMPFQLLSEPHPSTFSVHLQGLRDDVRTWLQDRTEYFSIPDLGELQSQSLTPMT
jgi:site-specific DNA recombinase